MGAAIAVLALAAVAHAGDVTPPNLAAQSSVQDTDLLLIWRDPGPLKKLNASVYEQYVQSKLANYWLQSSNNLSDVANATSARTNLGLGTAATVNTGTSGSALCLLTASCTWSAQQNFSGNATFGSTDFFVGVDGSSHKAIAFSVSGGVTVYYDGSAINFCNTLGHCAWVDNTGNVHAPAGFTGGLTGNASTASKWASAITLSNTGDATGSTTFDGSANASVALTLATVNGATGACGDASHVPVVTLDAKGRATGCTPTALGTASTATKWASPITLTLGGDLAGSASIDGSANVTLNGTVASASTSAAGKVALATAAQVTSGSDASHAITPAALAGACTVLGPVGLSTGSGGQLSYSLPATAVRAEPYLLVTSAIHSYGTGNVIPVGPQGSPGGSGANFGVGVWVIDSSHIGYIFGSNGIELLDASTGAQFSASAANFQLYVRACAY